MRAAIAAGAELLARTDADCLPRADWTASIRRSLTPRAAGGLGLRLVGGELVPRRDEGLGWPTRVALRGAVHLAEAFGRVRTGNRDPAYLGPYMMAAGCNVGITAELYLAAGGFPRTAIEDLHEDRALVNAVRRITSDYAAARRRRRVRVESRRVRAWGLKNTLLWYKDHAYRPEARGHPVTASPGSALARQHEERRVLRAAHPVAFPLRLGDPRAGAPRARASGSS